MQKSILEGWSFRETQIKHDMPLIDIMQGKSNWIQSLIIAITSYLKLVFPNEDKIVTTFSFLTHFILISDTALN